MGRPPKKLEFVVDGNGCMVCTSHVHNHDGYLRMCDRRIQTTGRAALTMFHRVVWECNRGPIPKGYEVDHICRNRACQNIDHLQLLNISEHKAKTNKERADDKRIEAKKYWQETGCTIPQLAEVFDVKLSRAKCWKIYWDKQSHS